MAFLFQPKQRLMNDVIPKHPMNGVRYTKPVRTKEDIHFLPREEQRIFLGLQNDLIITINTPLFRKQAYEQAN